MDYDDLPDDRVLINMEADDDSGDLSGASAMSFPELDEMLLDDDQGAPGVDDEGGTAFMPFIRTVQRIVLYETKAVRILLTLCCM